MQTYMFEDFIKDMENYMAGKTTVEPMSSKEKNENIYDPASLVDHPVHYNSGKIEVIDYIEDQKLGFCLGNAIKYISRAGKKNKDKEVEDLEKAIWYIKRRISEVEEEKKNTQYIDLTKSN